MDSIARKKIEAEIAKLKAQLAGMSPPASAPGIPPSRTHAYRDLLDCSFDSRTGRVLKITGRIAHGWTAHRKTYCFSRTKSFDFKFDRKIKVRLQVFPRPGGLADALARPPEGGNLGSDFPKGGLKHSFRDGIFTAEVKLRVSPSEISWLLESSRGPLPPTGADGNYWNPCLLMWTNSGLRFPPSSWKNLVFESRGQMYELQLFIDIQPPPSVAPIYRVWSQFCCGGLPSLGRRR